MFSNQKINMIAKTCLGLAGAICIYLIVPSTTAEAAMGGEAEAAAAVLYTSAVQWDDVKPPPGEFSQSKSWMPAGITESVPLATSSLRKQIWTDDYRPAPASFYEDQ
jgi:hypothetical protein